MFQGGIARVWTCGGVRAVMFWEERLMMGKNRQGAGGREHRLLDGVGGEADGAAGVGDGVDGYVPSAGVGD
eukprot:288167-Chlamydomonas_euryale.AAC.1